jgi:hypothetical protein
MDPERWRQVKEILYQALELPSDQRPAFLDRTCGSDISLRRELDSLISSGVTEDPGFLRSPVPLSAAIGPGIRLGDYEILSLLGAGGMGEVYRARDRRLERDVAIKVLGNLFVDPDRLRRFELEARAAAALNHPNILAVYYSGTHEVSLPGF